MVIVQTSTVGLEAALIGKRVLALQFAPSVIELGFDFSALDLAEAVPQMEDLVPVLERPAASVAAQRTRPPPGLAAPRVADEIMELAAQRGRPAQG